MHDDHRGRARGRWRRLAEAVVLSSPAFATPGGGYVVVASEDEARRRSIAAALSRDGHRVSEARAALELLELAHVAGPSLAHPSPPDAVVLDLTGRRWAKTEMLEVLNEAPSPPPLIALVDETTQAPGAAAVLRLPVDEAAVRAEVLSVVPPGPSFRGAA